MTFALATLRVDGAPTPVLSLDDRSWALADIAPDALRPEPSRGLMNVFDHWERTEPLLVAAAERLAAGTDTTPPLPPSATLEEVLTPLQYPRKVVMTGANYYEHMEKDGGHTDWEKDKKIPLLFLKPPTTTLVGCGRTVRYPEQTEKFDYELELAVVIGRRARKLTPDNAMEHVAGYTIALDLSARDWQRHPRHLVKFDLFGGKAFDDSCPLGPAIVPARYVDEDDLRLRFHLNGELRQDANTKDMIWSIPEQLVRITEHVTLEPGDVVCTGTPAGVGLGSNRWMKPGDLLEGEITGLGRLTVEIVEDRV
ncbi:fumarylacetoacetate hydrolase family protein [Streptomyces sp. MB09-02B]|uniref:fumarylacetoacetate hydrolase family protein n=1 Tax=Streptomyces sp. MB09-02B TaxID=3028667 RepID=UPI0029A466BB|nr:fumarylacetoacetate hydrolase family protein [Streptomyces sp. MB09-02B]MDX3641562.1 fumarylacetoacetate hydrolase family protein [Streptomyces sp. MB09-02B]